MRDRLGVVGVAVYEHDGELVPADADKEIGVTERARQSSAQLPQELVACRMAKGVVDLLEVIEVDEEESQGPVGGQRIVALGEECIEHTEEVPTVAETGQVVGHRLAVPFLAESLQTPARRAQVECQRREVWRLPDRWLRG